MNTPAPHHTHPLARPFFIVAAVLCLLPVVSASEALICGVVLALAFGNPYQAQTKKLTHRLLGIAIVGLGAEMNLMTVAQTGLAGLGYTVISIGATVLVGTVLGRVLKTSRDASILVTIGTAICGGSAIAATAPVLHAKHQDVSVALGVVFMLNALALVMFPAIGHALDLSQRQFGLWSALAIHDTSSVVGATLHYGSEALQVGTTVKLARALWIVPVTLLLGWLVRPSSAEEGASARKPTRPWFILGFLVMAAVMTWVPALQPLGHPVAFGAKRLLVLTLFLIGAGLTRSTFRDVGLAPFLQGFMLWVMIASATLLAITQGWIA